MGKKLVIGLMAGFISSAILVNTVFAEFGGGSNPPAVPEPVSILLLLASGGTYAGIRYLRTRRNSKKLNRDFHETNENR